MAKSEKEQDTADIRGNQTSAPVRAGFERKDLVRSIVVGQVLERPRSLKPYESGRW